MTYCQIVAIYSYLQHPALACFSVTSFATYAFNFYTNGSFEHANCMPPLLVWPHCITVSNKAHPYAVLMQELSASLFFYLIHCKLLNNPHLHVMSASYDLNSFEEEISTHLSDHNS